MWFLFMQLTDISIPEYVDRLYNQRERGNKLDMEIMSRIYKYVSLRIKSSFVSWTIK